MPSSNAYSCTTVGISEPLRIVPNDGRSTPEAAFDRIRTALMPILTDRPPAYTRRGSEETPPSLPLSGPPRYSALNDLTVSPRRPVMHRITATKPLDRLRTNAFAALSRSDSIIVGPNWIYIATPDELTQQLRRHRVTALTQGVYVATHGDPIAMRRTLAALIVLDVPRFTAILALWDSLAPNG